jgi:uncharacterized RDD family membrane protein YckC
MANCPKCSSIVNPGSKFCNHCGCNLEQFNSGRMACSACNTFYPPNVFFCPKDGTRLQLQAAKSTLKCSICGQSYPENTNFCPADGGRLVPLTSNNEGFTVAVTYSSNSNTAAYPKVNFGNRLLALIVDTFFFLLFGILAIYLFVTGVLQTATNRDAGVGTIILSLFACLVPIIYSLILDGLGNGQSWGKAALNLMVVNLDNNQPCSIGKSVVRNLVSGFISFIPVIGWAIDPLMAIISKDGRTLGDLAANTQVVETRHYYRKN